MQGILDFWARFIATYDITTEVVVIILSIILMAAIIIARPERNHMLNMIIVGTHCSLFTMLLHIAMLAETLVLNETHSMTGFKVVYCLHSLLYVAVICIVYLYMSHLSLHSRSNALISIINTCIMAIGSHIVMAYPLVTGKLFVVEDGIYKLTNWSNINVYTSVFCAVMCFVTIVYNRNSVSRIVFIGTMIFAPIDGLGAALQFFIPTAYFICATYFIPFLIFYVLFHAYRFDEITGSQYYEAETSMIKRRLSSKSDFILLSVFYPRLENLDHREIREKVVYYANEICRKIEGVHSGIHIYRISEYRYHIICPVKSETDFEKVARKLLDILEADIILGGERYKTSKHILVSRKFELIKDSDMYSSFINHMQRRFLNPDHSEVIYASETDCEKYVKGAMIETNLLDMRVSHAIDDERVLLYIQPIYSIDKNQFRTGEALMRMKIDGKLIFPDEFIPVAESIECIHTLTRIMLYKVAKKTLELSKAPNFEALTVNVSTFELDDPEVGKEFLDIIHSVGAKPENIRLEITESTTIVDYSRIIANMEYLISNGIQFYLDDFGTGYSNLERISRFPFKTIKFDKSLLYRALEDKSSEELFSVLLNHFKTRGFNTVIEGVEDEGQKEYVKKNGFDYIQGYFYSRPVPETEINHFFE